MTTVLRAVHGLVVVRSGRMACRVVVSGGPGGRMGLPFGQQFRLPLLERKQKLVLCRLGLGERRRYQTTYRFLPKLRLFESDRAEWIVVGGRRSEDGTREEESNKRAWK